MAQNNCLPKIIFFEVRSNRGKLEKISTLASSHFENGDSLLIFVKDSMAAKYVDEWLWKYPHNSFLPHAIAKNYSSEKIIISSEIVPDSTSLLNLCPTPLILPQNCSLQVVYEFADASFQNLVKKKMHYYNEKGYPIESLSLE